MEDRLRQIEKEAAEEINRAQSQEELENLQRKFIGRKGMITEVLRNICEIPPEKRALIGKLANELKQNVISQIENKCASLSESDVAQVHEEIIDITLPGIKTDVGYSHIITQTIEQITEIFISLGFKVVEGPEIETEYYNFEALNIPEDHPSRETFDTFYIKDDILLRSHTSPVQIRFMKRNRPPVKIIVPGKVFRPDAVNASHSFMFHQVEGLMVGDDITFSDLKGILSVFVSRMFKSGVRMRFRPHFFPFTEPSVEVDISCIICGGKGCRVCSQKGWLEILGAGMVHPNVFEAVGYDPEKFIGFAFGMGVERIAMLRHGIDDIRLFFENDIRFLKQF